ncbi:MAG TPA: DUF4303 domain-containing protein [Herpetosiphonaceae bacterium]|nr:DUF4303 domain-containing protein [Herpetosiphonaceae bacterium]
MPDIDYDALRTALLDATRQALIHMIALTGDDHLYAFGLYVHDEMTYAVPTSNTEEGLLERAKQYAQNKGGSIEYYAKRLRWLPADWQYHCEGANFFSEVETILLGGWREDFSFFDPDRTKISAICMDALRACRAMLDREGQGQSMLINLFYIDISAIKRLQLAEQLNPTHLYAQYKHDLETWV